MLAFGPRSKPFKVPGIAVLGFRIALRNGSQWGRTMRRRAAGGGDCRYARRSDDGGKARDGRRALRARRGIQAAGFGVGGLIHVAVGFLGGTGGFLTKRSGFAANAWLRVS